MMAKLLQITEAIRAENYRPKRSGAKHRLGIITDV
jgi:hypothetical protein